MKYLAGFTLVGLTALMLVSINGCSDDDPASPGDTTPPNVVTDLQVQAISDSVLTVAWTAPGDDGAEGKAARYDIRYNATTITAGTWTACSQVAAVPEPAAAGTQQSVEITSPTRSDIYVALKAADEVPNWSGLSNVVYGSFGSGFEVRQLTTEGNNIQPCLHSNVVSWVRWNTVTGDEIYVSNLAVGYPAETRLTDNGGEKANPSSHGSEKIVWQGRSGGVDDWEIFQYDAYQIPRYSALTDNDIHDRYPVLAGGGDFAWLQGLTMFEEVHYWNEIVHSESVISNGCCPISENGNDPPTADDNSVVWRTFDRVGSEEDRTIHWRGVVTDLTDEVDGVMSHNFSLHEEALAYEWGASPSLITYWDGVTAQTIAEGHEPSLYHGTIAYQVWDGQDWEIHFWDGSAIIEITDNDYNDTQPTLYDDIIAWVGRPAGSSDQIFFVRLP